MKLFDITRPIYQGMAVYPGDPEVFVERVASIATGAMANVSRVRFGSHTGTHVDPPLHFCDGTRPVDEIPLDMLIGTARVYELDGGDAIDAAVVNALDLSRYRRALFKTRISERRDAAGAGFTAEAAHALVAAGLRVVGVDSPSVDALTAVECPVHRILLAAGVVVVENLDLSVVPPGAYELICLPLKLRGGDGAPARVVLRTID